MARAGWGRRLLDLQDAGGLWGGGLYTPKWTSTTYTLLLLSQCGLPEGHPQAKKGALLLLDKGLDPDGGINLWRPRWKHSETCVTGMILGIASRFSPGDRRNDSLADYLLRQQMPDGGWNCRYPARATHSSMHTTISALEGLLAYDPAATRPARERAHEFLFAHRMFRSHRTGRVIDSKMTRFTFPPQWHYDVLRGLDYLRAAAAPWDPRLQDAIDLLEKKRDAQGKWPLQNPHHGVYHFELEPPGQPSRWNTLRALRVLDWAQHVGGAGAFACAK